MPDTERDLIPVVDYSRASADKARDEHTVEDQQRVNARTAARLGCRIVHRFKDNDKSAAKEGVVRDDFEEMLRVIRAGRLADGTPVMGVIVTADDRLVRRAGDYERFVDALTYQDGRVYADARGFKDLYSEDVESMGLMGAVFARMEVKKTRRRVRRWHQSRAERGIAPAGPRPFGWQADRVTPDPVEAALIRRAVEEAIAGRSMNSIVREWQRNGVKTPRGNDWLQGPFKKMLKNPRLCGWRMINGELVTDGGTPVQGDWEPLITPDQWQALQAIFQARSGHQVSTDGQPLYLLDRDHREHRYLLSGILRCGRILEDGSMCMARLRVSMQPDRSAHRYFCRAKTNGGCGSLSRRGDKIDEFVSEAVLAKLEERTIAAQKDSGPWLGEKELNDYQEQLKELRKHWAARQISNSLFFEESRRLEGDISRLRAERQQYAAAQQKATTDMADVRRRWYLPEEEGGLPISTKRTYVKEALHAVIVHPAGKGHGAGKRFNPDLLEPIWRED
ncbi:recombinase family protein [Actinoallomurus soli]|uniref:recombinase family protein n=1 Tax=Actinoallomurus soli TaxID=2952535 RepID=UPI002092D9DE|nr:recombinase family protein [Actinoallomurus soli]MCO5968526.1 recombinase family protein [Actinoallomurus soli]